MAVQKHLDGTICMGRKSMPSKARIASYWRDKSYDLFDYAMDWGEPSCWACDYWNEVYPDVNESDEGEKGIFMYWNKHRYLQRCHIVPKSHGGCNCEANLVLMCRECHKESPDTKSPKSFLTWIKNRKSWIYYRTQKLTEAISNMEYEIEDRDEQIIVSESFKAYFIQNAIPVGGKYASSTILACLDEFKKNENE